MEPQTVEQAYVTLGLDVYATAVEVEQRYEMLIRKLRSKQVRGLLTAREEAEMNSVSRAYRIILTEQSRKLSERYRVRKYGKFKRFAGFAEAADHFLSYHRFEICGGLLLAAFILLAPAIFHPLHARQPAAAKQDEADLSVVVSGENLPGMHPQANTATELAWLRMMPGWKHIELSFIPFTADESGDKGDFPAYRSELALLSKNPDLYIVDRDNFIRLARLGYLAKLEEWDTFGVDVSESAAAGLLQVPFRPAIAAVRGNAGHPGNALLFIRSLLGNENAAPRERYMRAP